MFHWIREWYRSRSQEPWIRPWGLAAPILVLVICLPILRPLRQIEDQPTLSATAPTLPVGLRPAIDISDNELTRLATVQAIVENGTLAVDDTSFYLASQGEGDGQRLCPVNRRPTAGPRHYSPQPPVLALLLAGPYWVLTKLGIAFDTNLVLATYLLTILCATLPVAVSAGLVYRMGRVFELRRAWRVLLSFATVFASGLVSYATALNAHAPAAMLVIGACSALLHAGFTRHPRNTLAWLCASGFLGGFAAVIDMGAAILLLMLLAVVLSFAWPLRRRMKGLAFFILGALPPLALHCTLTVPITGDLRPGFLHADPSSGQLSFYTVPVPRDEEEAPGFVAVTLGRLAMGVIGTRGLLTHFPVIVLGLIGIATIIRRNWPAPMKAMAVVTLLSGSLIITTYAVLNADWAQPMFAVRWFILFLPMIVFWGGAWLRQRHHPVAWATAGLLLAFSIATTLLGATNPFTPVRNGEYTAYAAARQLLHGPSATQPGPSRYFSGPLVTYVGKH